MDKRDIKLSDWHRIIFGDAPAEFMLEVAVRTAKAIVFTGVQKDIWTYDSTAHEYYNHSFYNFEPDLNLQNLQVRKELFKVMQFWLQTGIAGLELMQ